MITLLCSTHFGRVCALARGATRQGQHQDQAHQSLHSLIIYLLTWSAPLWRDSAVEAPGMRHLSQRPKKLKVRSHACCDQTGSYWVAGMRPGPTAVSLAKAWCAR
jgi:hypothetical protein